ncbi:putative secreted protein (Por secretion system target) [Nonlabens dokdonensis]|uniref:Secreted protein (Por secretion system target) n=2 Tax=Nonlabens dokdonensis TaxID=328515 RepID=A0ABX5PWJ1_9FLAO|nr:fibronectin type III domain-containing protein [Nonlabens dokdonensis]AGC78718.1 putative hemagluttinin family protein [Nonlabens dokdonensis DSW-6]PZX39155.1 putative secreted protein (Por secretion system target) [Nonlabens dokdonensis]
MKQIYVFLIAMFCLILTVETHAQCNYQLELTDFFGNDWDSGANLARNTGVDVTVDGVTSTYVITNPGTPNMDNTEVYPITVNDMSTIVIDYRSPEFPGDGGFRLLDSEGLLVYESPLAQTDQMNIFSGNASCPTCPVVTNIVVSSVTANEADIAWTNGGAETEWEIEYGISPYTVGNGGVIVPAPTNPFTLMNLSSVTTYDIYVRAVCVPGTDLSASAGPITFTTAESCPSPSNFAPITQSAFEVQFTWDANGNTSTNYEVNYGLDGYVQGAPGGFTESGSFGNFALIDGLMSDTCYSFYVRYDCGMGDFSLWGGPYNACTSISCPEISGLTAAATDSTLDISWAAGGAETEWEVDYALAGVITTPGTGQGIPAQGTTQTTTALNLTSLPSATAYDVYVRAICDASTNDLSQWVNATFVTLPSAPDGVTCPNNDSAFAWDDGFDSGTVTWTGDTGTVNGNWDFTGTGGTGSTGTGPLGPEVGTGYVFFDTSGTNVGPRSMVSPVIDLTNATDEAELSFYFHSFGGDLTLFDVSVGTSPTGPFTSIFAYQGPLQANQADPFVLVGADMPAFVLGSSTVYIQLTATEEAGNETGFVGDIAVDLMRIETCGAFCSNPDMLMVDNITTNSVDISFNDTNGTAAGAYEYVIQAPGTGIPTAAGTAATTTMITDSSLTPATSYEVYVRTMCGGMAGESDWIGPVNFSTACVPFTVTYTTDYETVPVDELFVCDNSIVIGTGFTDPIVIVDDLIALSGSRHINMASQSAGASAELYYILPEFSDLSSDKRLRFNVYDRDNGELEVGTITDPTDPMTFTSLVTLTDADMADDVYEEKSVYFNSLTTTGGFIAFKFNPVATFDAIYLDDITYELSPACPEPTNVSVDSFTDTTADISWIDNTVGGTASFEVLVQDAGSPAPDATTTGVQQVATSNPYTWSGLTAFTDYDVYVRAVCTGTAGESVWTGPVSFQTACSSFAAPFFEDFENFTATTNGFPGAADGFVAENCWSGSVANYNWVVAPPTLTGSTATGPAPSVTTGNYMYTEGSAGATADIAELTSPLIDLTPLSAPELRFDYHMTGADIDQLEVFVQAAGVETSVLLITGAQQVADTDPYLESIVDLSAYNGQTITIIWKATKGSSFESDIAIDNVRVDVAPDCANVSDLAATAISSTTANLEWVENDMATIWEFEYDVEGYVLGSSTAGVQSTSSNSTNPISGLLPNTEYDFYVRSLCAVSGTSNWVGPFTFTTRCAALTAPYFTDYDSDPLGGLNNCDSNLIVGSGTGTAPIVEVDDLVSNSGGQHINMASQSTGATAEMYYILPEFSDLDNTKRVRFFAYDRDLGGLEVGTMTDPADATTFTAVQVFTNADLPDDQYVEQTVEFTSLTTTGGWIAFKFNPVATFDAMYIDDVNYEEIPNCPQPSLVTSANITENSVELSWTAGGTETEWIVEYGTPGFTPGGAGSLGTRTGVMTNTSYVLDMLTSTTQYEVRIFAVCGPNDTSPASNPITFVTLPSAPQGVTCPNNDNAFAWEEGFENGAGGWTGAVGTANGEWDFSGGSAANGGTGSTGTGPFAPADGTRYVFFETSGTTVGPRSMVSPAIDLSAATDEAELSFFMHSVGGDQTIFEVGVGTSPTGPFTNVFTYIGPLQSAQADPYALVGASLPASVLGSATVHIQITATEEPGNETGFVGDIALDLMRIETCGNYCSNPDSFAVANLGPNGGDFSFNDTLGTPSGSYEYVLQPDGTGVPTAAGTPLTTTSFTDNTLTPATSYEVYYRTICGPMTNSDWVGPFQFITPCLPFTAPYFTDFENDPLNGLFVCDNAIIDNATVGTPLVQVDDLIANSGSQHMYLTSSSDASVGLYYVMPEFSDLNNTKRVRFFAYDRDFGGLEVGVMSDPNDITTFNLIQTFTNADLPDDQYAEQTVNFTSLTTTGGHIAFRFVQAGTFDAMFLDDINYEEIPSCPNPNGLSVNSIGDDNLDLSWNPGNTETEWIVEYATPDFATGTPVQVTGVTSNTNYILNNLTPNTPYQVRVFAVCNPMDISPSTNPVTTRTFPLGPQGVSCTTGAPGYIWEDSFENGIGGWTGDVGTANGQWDFTGGSAANGGTGSTGTGPFAPADGSRYVFFESSGGINGTPVVSSMVSPPIDLTMGANDELELSFFFHSFGGDQTIFEVGYGTSATGPFTNVFTYVGSLQTAQTDPYAQLGAMLPSTLIGQTIYIQITATEEPGGEGGFVGDIALDLMRIQTCGTFCSAPSGVSVSAIGSDTATIGWTENGNATVWEVAVQAAGTGVPTGNGTSTTNNPYTDSTLMPATDYEVYVRADCGGGFFSDWTSVETFSTLCAPFVAPYGSITGTPGNDFSTFPGACWEEGDNTDIATGPNGVDGDWINDDFGNDPSSTFGQAARVNIWNLGGANDWLVSPEIDLGTNPSTMLTASFDIALTAFDATTVENFGSDDEVQFLITVDNGVTWTNIATYNSASNVSNVGQQETFPLSAYSGIVRFAFWSTNGTVADGNDVDFFVDNFTVDGTVGVDDSETLEFSYYPNPTNDVVSFNGQQVIDGITVRNLLGQQLFVTKPNATSTTIDLSAFPSGMYLIEVASGEQSKVVKVMRN